ncbi:hypothetical protein Ddc_05110 [Ditylenchus destructor]|nr:hypothetical protein Ddc_05110 [Ditylenchus destructor]
MAESDNMELWNTFLSMARMFKKLPATLKTNTAKVMIHYQEQLIENQFFNDTPERTEMLKQCEEICADVAPLLEGDVYYIKQAAVSYFKAHPEIQQSEPVFSFEKKTEGIRTGVIFTMTAITRFYIKTHQDGPESRSSKSTNPPDLKELFIYKVLEFTGIGPEAHFILPSHTSRKTIYIATREIQDLRLLEKLSKSGEMTPDMWKAMLTFAWLGIIFRLQDMHQQNCGMADGLPKIVDFHPQTSFAKWMQHKESKELFLAEWEKKDSRKGAVEMGKTFLDTWQILESIDKAQIEVESFDSGGVEVTNDLKTYVGHVKKNAELFHNCMNQVPRKELPGKSEQ